MQEERFGEEGKILQNVHVNEEKQALQASEEKQAVQTEQTAQAEQKISATWAEETIMDLDDFIESQGVYIRQ